MENLNLKELNVDELNELKDKVFEEVSKRLLEEKHQAEDRIKSLLAEVNGLSDKYGIDLYAYSKDDGCEHCVEDLCCY